MNPKSEPKSESKLESKLESKSESKLKSKLESKLKSTISSQFSKLIIFNNFSRFILRVEPRAYFYILITSVFSEDLAAKMK